MRERRREEGGRRERERERRKERGRREEGRERDVHKHINQNYIAKDLTSIHYNIYRHLTSKVSQ